MSFNLTFPDDNDIRYTKDNVWIAFSPNAEENKTQIVWSGITDIVQAEMGQVLDISINPNPDKIIVAGAVYGQITFDLGNFDLIMPITGKILGLNLHIIDNPELVNSDPYYEGKLIYIQIEQGVDLSHLLTAAQYKALLGR